MNEHTADDMCPNCVTPWKCNGPHLSQAPEADALSGLAAQFDAWARQCRGIPGAADAYHHAADELRRVTSPAKSEGAA